MTDKPKVYLDSCCFIDAAKYRDAGSAPDDKKQDVWFTQQLLRASEAGDIQVHTSSLTIAECTHVGEHPPPEEIKRLFRSILISGKIVHLVADSIFIAEKARDLRWDYDMTLKGADAIHVATALEVECTEFVTSDGRGPHKNGAKIAALGCKVVRAQNTQVLPETYGQPSLFAATPAEPVRDGEAKPDVAQEAAQNPPEAPPEAPIQAKEPALAEAADPPKEQKNGSDPEPPTHN